VIRGAKPRRAPSHERLLAGVASFSINYKILVTLASLVALIVSYYILVDQGLEYNLALALPVKGLYASGLKVFSEYFPLSIVSKVIVVANSSEASTVLNSLPASEYVRDINVSIHGDYSIIVVGLNIDPYSDEAVEIARRIARVVGGLAYVTGIPAIRADVLDYITGDFYHKTIPLAVGLIVAYLALGLGSLLVPLRLVYTVGLSSMASLAIALVLSKVFWGYGLYWTVPLVVLGLLLTIGMDYDVFLVTRVLEEKRRGLEDDEALVVAVERTGLVITVCGILLAAAFSSLLTTDLPVLLESGIATASSILIDTFIVRPSLVPAIMSIAGRLNWWPGKGAVVEVTRH